MDLVGHVCITSISTVAPPIHAYITATSTPDPQHPLATTHRAATSCKKKRTMSIVLLVFGLENLVGHRGRPFSATAWTRSWNNVIWILFETLAAFIAS